MKISKRFLFAAALVLVVGLCFGAMAQGKMPRKSPAFELPPEPIPSTVSVNAIEIAAGTLVGSFTQPLTIFGHTFLGKTTGEFPGSLTLSLNYSPTTRQPGETNGVTGGAWTLPVYGAIKGAGYAGSLYGTVANGGTIIWDKPATSATVYLSLNVDGGTQQWDGVQGTATFVGILVIEEKSQKVTLSGDLVFGYMSMK